MTMQEVLDRINDIIDNHNHHELDLLRSDLEDDIIWEIKKKKKSKFPDYQSLGDEVI